MVACGFSRCIATQGRDVAVARHQKADASCLCTGSQNCSVQHRLALLLILLSCLFSLPSLAQNKGTITPVDSDDEAPQKPILHYYDKHGEKLETPVYYLAELDTVSSVRPASPYPLINGFTFGINFGDAIMKLVGQKHQSYDISAMMSFHNWFFPVIEAGIGWGDHTGSNDLYKIKAKPSFYGKVGINYNFLYKSKPDYMAYLGLRFGFSRHTWDITDIKSTADLTNVPEGVTEMLNQSCMSIYGEVVAGLKVKIAGPFSLGWNVRYRVAKHNSKKADPWFIPGYGSNPLGVNICAYFTFGEKPRRDLPLIPVSGVGVPDIPASPDSGESLSSPGSGESSSSPDSDLHSSSDSNLPSSSQ